MARFIQDQAPVLAKGRAIFKDYGCRGCHLVRGKERIMVGPPLDRMSQTGQTRLALSLGLKSKRLSSQSKNARPQIFPAASGGRGRPSLSRRETPGGPGGQIHRRRLKKCSCDSRCVSCHSVEGKGGTLAPELSKISSKMVPERLIRVIKNPHELWARFTDAHLWFFRSGNPQDGRLYAGRIYRSGAG